MQERRFAIGSNGAIVKVNSPLIKGWEKVDTLEQLLSAIDYPLRDDIIVETKWAGAKLPAEELKRVLGTIHEFPNMETGYVLCYRLSDNTWKVVCTEQKGSGASTHFEATEIPDGYAEVGTIHTHPNMGAFWSGTDLHDFKDTPGVYVVFGLENGKPKHHLCSIFRNNHQYDQNIWDVFEEVDLQGDYEPDKEWVELIKKQSYIRREDPLEAIRRKTHGWSPVAESVRNRLRSWRDMDGDSARHDMDMPYGLGYSGRWPRNEASFSGYGFDKREGKEEVLSDSDRHLDWIMECILAEGTSNIEEILNSVKRVGSDSDMTVVGFVLDSVSWPEDTIDPVVELLDKVLDVWEEECDDTEKKCILDKLNTRLAVELGLKLTMLSDKQVNKAVKGALEEAEKEDGKGCSMSM